MKRRSKWDSILSSLAQDYEAGLSTYQLQAKYDIPNNSVWYCLKRIGILLRPQKEVACHQGLKNAKQIKLLPSSQLAYLCGVILGDGYVAQNSFQFNIKDRDFADAIIVASEFLGLHMTEDKCRDLIRLRTHSVNFAKWWQSDRQTFVLNLNGFSADFVRGFFDAEGSLVTTLHQKHIHYTAKIANTNTGLIVLVRSLLERQGYHPKLYSHKSGFGFRPCYIIQLHRKAEVLHFIDWVRPNIERKRRILCKV